MAKLTPEQQIRANVMAAMGKHQTQPVKKQNIFIVGVCKSASRTRSTDLAEIVEKCESLPVSDPVLAALVLICCHNNTQIRTKAIATAGEDPGAITPEQIALATGEEFSAFDIAGTIAELMAVGVLDFDNDGFYRVTVYSE